MKLPYASTSTGTLPSCPCGGNPPVHQTTATSAGEWRPFQRFTIHVPTKEEVETREFEEQMNRLNRRLRSVR